MDAWRFESLLNTTLQAAARAPERAWNRVDDALALWQGAAYAEFADEEWAVAEVARLTELHLVAQEARVEVMLRTGGTAQAAPVAEVLTRRQPLREEAGGCLLSRSGRASGRPMRSPRCAAPGRCCGRNSGGSRPGAH